MSLLKKRKNLNKDQIKEQIANEQKIARLKEIVNKAFPSIEDMDSIYDAQTVVNALAGLISVEIEKEVESIKLSSIIIDLSEEKDGKIKSAIEDLVSKFQDESAQVFSETLERIGTTLQAYVSNEGMKAKMDIKIEDILSK